MSIAQATQHLASSLIPRFERNAEDITALTLLKQVSRLSDYLEVGDLAEWERTTLASLSEVEWEIVEQRDDFPLIDLVWDVGRSNLFGAIQPKETEYLYRNAAKELADTFDIKVRDSSEFDFTRW